MSPPTHRPHSEYHQSRTYASCIHPNSTPQRRQPSTHPACKSHALHTHPSLRSPLPLPRTRSRPHSPTFLALPEHAPPLPLPHGLIPPAPAKTSQPAPLPPPRCANLLDLLSTIARRRCGLDARACMYTAQYNARPDVHNRGARPLIHCIDLFGMGIGLGVARAPARRDRGGRVRLHLARLSTWVG